MKKNIRVSGRKKKRERENHYITWGEKPTISFIITRYYNGNNRHPSDYHGTKASDTHR